MTINCSSCSATPTPASLVAEAFAKGDPRDTTKPATALSIDKFTAKKSEDTVQISAQAGALSQQSATDPSTLNPIRKAVDVYSRPLLSKPA